MGRCRYHEDQAAHLQPVATPPRSAGRGLSSGLSDDAGFGHWAPSARDLDAAFAAITASSDYPYGRPHRRSNPNTRFAFVKDR